MQSCIRLQNFLHFSHVTRSHFSFRYTNFTSLTFPQKTKTARQWHSYITGLQQEGKRNRKKQKCSPARTRRKHQDVRHPHLPCRMAPTTAKQGRMEEDHKTTTGRNQSCIQGRPGQAMVDACRSRTHTSTGSHSPARWPAVAASAPIRVRARLQAHTPYQTRPTATDPRLR